MTLEKQPRLSFKKKRTPITYEANKDVSFDRFQLVNLRKSFNMSQQEFALAMGVTERTIGLWEAGTNNPPRTSQHLLYAFSLDKNLIFQFVTVKKKTSN